MSTCNRLDLQTPRSQPTILPKNLADEWIGVLDIAPHSYCGRVCDWQIISNAKGNFNTHSNYGVPIFKTSFQRCIMILSHVSTNLRFSAFQENSIC